MNSTTSSVVVEWLIRIRTMAGITAEDASYQVGWPEILIGYEMTRTIPLQELARLTEIYGMKPEQTKMEAMRLQAKPFANRFQ